MQRREVAEALLRRSEKLEALGRLAPPRVSSRNHQGFTETRVQTSWRVSRYKRSREALLKGD